MFRNPAVAGSFYPSNPQELMESIKNCVDEKAVRERVKGIVSPHAGYIYSGKVAGAVYSKIELPDTFIILGPNHSGWGSEYSLMKDGMWKMPFDDVQVDSELAIEILSGSRVLDDDANAHQGEHSIEVQIPFMQYYSKDFQIVPIAMRHYIPDDRYLKACEDIAHSIADAVKSTRRNAVIVASTDFTHYESQNSAERKDKAVLEKVLELNPKRMFQKIIELDVSMCGYGPVAVMLQAAKELGARGADLVQYMTSGDVTGDRSQVVGYAGVLVK